MTPSPTSLPLVSSVSSLNPSSTPSTSISTSPSTPSTTPSSPSPSLTIGVLSYHGSVSEHMAHLQRASTCTSSPLNFSLNAIEVRTPSDLSLCDGIILPGGESTVFHSLSERSGLWDSLLHFIHKDKKCVFGTCAGLILLSEEIEGGIVGQKTLGGMRIKTKRNAFGRQNGSFVGKVKCEGYLGETRNNKNNLNDKLIENEIKESKSTNSISNVDECVGVFIRAPGILSMESSSSSPSPTLSPSPLSVLGKVSVKGKDEICAVGNDHLLGLTFHPELTDDLRWHGKFIQMCWERKNKK